jgi:hypothetical protein
MPRKPSEITQIGLRLRERLRVRLERAAKARGTSLNSEMADRLARSFDVASIEAMADDVRKLIAQVQGDTNRP